MGEMGEFIIRSKDKRVNLKDFNSDYTDELLKKDIEEEYLKLKERFVELQDVFYAAKKYSLLVILQGMDCSGKDGTIKKVLNGVNPNGFSVENFKEPNSEELGHDYLWRIHKKMPMKGNIMVFNRSYYEDVLVTRVHKAIDDDTAYSRLKEINEFEKYLVNNNIIVLKFFLHISKEFQKEKLENRLKLPEKHWKFSESDLKERRFWDKYQECYSDVLSNCSTKEAPWYVIPANHRWFRDYIVLKNIVNTLEELKLEYPPLKGNIQELIQELKESR
ncbi:MAG: polyphosphate:nucleotide phosphotransferase, PPK2 family [Clostridium sp. Maddingley MBC34-26]|nr:MAG: polyphosphate:nucleotide phosphotransferase, PPK2 family [Clostridium sp. Maddingley MBC34-26]